MKAIYKTSRFNYRRVLVRFFIIGLVALSQVGSADARTAHKTVTFPEATVTLEDQLRLPDIFPISPTNPWIPNKSDTKKVSLPRFEVPLEWKVDSAKFALGIDVSAFPQMFTNVTPPEAQARLQSFRNVGLAIYDKTGGTGLSNKYELASNLGRIYSRPYENTPFTWPPIDANLPINSAVLGQPSGSASNQGFDIDLTLNAIIRMSGTWSGQWRGIVNVYESSSMAQSIATIEVDLQPLPTPLAFTDIELFPSTDDSRGQLGADAVKNDLEFGAIRVGTSERKTIELKNIGASASKLVGTVGGIFDASLENFSIVGDPSFRELRGGESDTKVVAFMPSQLGYATEYIAVETGIDDFYVLATGLGSGPSLRFVDGPDVIDFGTIGIGESKTLPLILRNELTDVLNRRHEALDITGLTIKRIDVTGPGFQVANFSPFVLHDSSGYSLDGRIDIEYVGDRTLGSANGMLRIFTDQGAAFGADGQVFELPLTAIAVPSPNSGRLVIPGLAAFVLFRSRDSSVRPASRRT